MQETKIQIYGSKEKYYERSRLKTENSTISLENKAIITRYETYLASTGKTGELTRIDRSQKLRTICEWLEKLSLKTKINTNLASLTKQDAETLIAYINTLKGLSLHTKATYRKRLKQFYKWFEDEDMRFDNGQKEEAHKFYKYLKKVNSDAKITQADLETTITDEDCQKVLENGCKMPKEKAFISLLHESGCRASEFLNLRIGDLKFKENILEINVPDGKTGKRVIYATGRSIKPLLIYLEGHPFKDNKLSPLWISEGSRHNNQPLLHIGGQKLINRCFERAKVNKKHNWHWFRHSRATILAPKLTEIMICKYMGWSSGSQQIRRYAHLGNTQLESVFLDMHGLKNVEKEKEIQLKCVCGTLNNSKERYCYKCFRPLSVEVAIQEKDESIQLMTQETLKTMQFFMDMSKNPELMKKFEEFKNK